MNKQRAQEIRARLNAATPGPWEADALEGYVVAPSGRVATVTMWRDADADLIAHAPTDLADLLAERETLIAENARLRRIAGLATVGAAELAIERLTAENDRLRAVADAAIRWHDAYFKPGVTGREMTGCIDTLTTAVRAYRADTTGGE